MKEKVVWTMDGRKKIFLVDENNIVQKEIKDLGPLSEIEMKWVRSGSELPYKQWLETLEDEEKEGGEKKGSTEGG